MLVTSMFSFSVNVAKNITSGTFSLSSANAFNLVLSKNYSFGKEVNTKVQS